MEGEDGRGGRQIVVFVVAYVLSTAVFAQLPIASPFTSDAPDSIAPVDFKVVGD